MGPVVAGVPVPRLSSMLSFGVRGMLGASSPIEYYRLDQAVVGLFLAPVALGIYTVAIAFTNLPRFVSTSVGMVAYPAVAAEQDRMAGYARLRRFSAVTVLACAAIVGTLELTAGWLVPFFFGSEFEDAVPIARIVLVSAFLISVRRILSDGARGLGLPGLGTLGEIVSLVALAPAMVVFLPLWDAKGVAFALVIAGIVSLPVVVIGLRRAAARGFEPVARTSPARRIRHGAIAVGGPLGALLLVVLADAAAVGLTLVSPLLAALAAALVLFCLAVVAVRRRLDSPVSEDAEPPEEAEPDPGLGPARALYYLGLVLLGLLVVRPAAGLSLSDLVFLGAFGLTLAGLATSGREGPVFLGPVLMVGVLLFAVGGLASSFGADSPAESITVVARVVYLTVVWFWLGSVLLTKVSHVRTAIACWVASAALGGAGAIAQTLFGDVIPGGVVHFGRVSGFTYDVNDLGGLCGVAAVPATMLLASAKSLAGRLAALAALLLIVAGLLLSGSVTAVGAALAGGVVWLAIVRPPLRLVVPVALAIVVFSAFAASSNRYWQSPVQRFATSSQQSGTADSTLFTRVDSYEAAWSTSRARRSSGSASPARRRERTPAPACTTCSSVRGTRPGSSPSRASSCSWPRRSRWMAGGGEGTEPGGAPPRRGAVRRGCGVRGVRAGAGSSLPALRMGLGALLAALRAQQRSREIATRPSGARPGRSPSPSPAGEPMRVVLLRPAIGDYRRPVLELLAERLRGELEVLAGDEDFAPTSRTTSRPRRPASSGAQPLPARAANAVAAPAACVRCWAPTWPCWSSIRACSPRGS